MSTAVLISIHPKWCEKIADGNKTIEVRKTRPKIDTPFKCFIYCTEPNTKNPWKLLEIHSSDGKIHKGNGKVIGEFICDEISPLSFYVNGISFFDAEPPFTIPDTCLTDREIAKYLGIWKTKDGWHITGYGWHISDLKTYDEPKELSEFGLKRPPQSWCYVEAENG